MFIQVQLNLKSHVFGLFSQIARTHARFMLYKCHYAQNAKNCQISVYTCPRINKKFKFDQISKFNLKLKFLEFNSKSEKSAFTGLVRQAGHVRPVRLARITQITRLTRITPDNLRIPEQSD